MKFRINKLVLSLWMVIPAILFSTSVQAQQSFKVSDQLNQANSDQVPVASSSDIQRRAGLLLHGGAYAPLGLMLLSESKGMGVYLAVRLNTNIFNESSDYTLSSKGIDSDYWDFEYAGESEYRRASFTIGLNHRLIGDLDKISLHGYGGIGYGLASYFYKYEVTSFNGNFGKQWVKDVDLSQQGLEVEGGLIMNFNGLNLSLGVTTIKFKEPMFTAGFGYAFWNNR